jgi:single-strand DNA-binding protein
VREHKHIFIKESIMNSLNSIILEGNVVRAPQIRETSRGSQVCSLPIAVNRWYKSADGTVQEEVSFFDVSSWGDLAAACAENCEKGRGVRVVGRLKQDRWIDQSGKNRSKVYVVADHIEFKVRKTPEALHGQERSSEFRDLLEAAASASFEASQDDPAF